MLGDNDLKFKSGNTREFGRGLLIFDSLIGVFIVSIK